VRTSPGVPPVSRPAPSLRTSPLPSGCPSAARRTPVTALTPVAPVRAREAPTGDRSFSFRLAFPLKPVSGPGGLFSGYRSHVVRLDQADEVQDQRALPGCAGPQGRRQGVGAGGAAGRRGAVQ